MILPTDEHGEENSQGVISATSMGNTPLAGTRSAYKLTRSQYGGGGDVFRNGERIGHYWPDKYGGYAVFRTGNAKPVARRKTEAGCIRKLTNGAWTGKG